MGQLAEQSAYLEVAYLVLTASCPRRPSWRRGPRTSPTTRSSTRKTGADRPLGVGGYEAVCAGVLGRRISGCDLARPPAGAGTSPVGWASWQRQTKSTPGCSRCSAKRCLSKCGRRSMPRPGKLQTMVVRRRQLVEMLTMEKNRRPRVRRASAQEPRQAHRLAGRSGSTRERRYQPSVRQSPLWREKEDLLRLFKGIGPVSARTILVELPSRQARLQVSRLSSVSPLSITTAADSKANAPSLGDDPTYAPSSTWLRSQPPATTRSFDRSTSA